MVLESTANDETRKDPKTIKSQKRLSCPLKKCMLTYSVVLVVVLVVVAGGGQPKGQNSASPTSSNTEHVPPPIKSRIKKSRIP